MLDPRLNQSVETIFVEQAFSVEAITKSFPQHLKVTLRQSTPALIMVCQDQQIAYSLRAEQLTNTELTNIPVIQFTDCQNPLYTQPNQQVIYTLLQIIDQANNSFPNAQQIVVHNYNHFSLETKDGLTVVFRYPEGEAALSTAEKILEHTEQTQQWQRLDVRFPHPVVATNSATLQNQDSE